MCARQEIQPQPRREREREREREGRRNRNDEQTYARSSKYICTAISNLPKNVLLVALSMAHDTSIAFVCTPLVLLKIRLSGTGSSWRVVSMWSAMSDEQPHEDSSQWLVAVVVVDEIVVVVVVVVDLVVALTAEVELRSAAVLAVVVLVRHTPKYPSWFRGIAT